MYITVCHDHGVRRKGGREVHIRESEITKQQEFCYVHENSYTARTTFLRATKDINTYIAHNTPRENKGH